MIRFTTLGARGSFPRDGADYSLFGGATSSYLFETEEEAVFLDAGSGIADAPDVGDKRITILLTHPHLDHLIGLPMFPYMSRSGRKIDIYAVSRMGLSTKDMLNKVFSPPYWPLKLFDYPCMFEAHDLEFPFHLGDITVLGMESRHPGGSSIFRLEYEDKSIVLATDFEHGDGKERELSVFAMGTDLFIYDAQYTEEEYNIKRGFGHSTMVEGLRVAERAGAKRTIFTHHDPEHNDEMLLKIEEEVRLKGGDLARKGNVIEL